MKFMKLGTKPDAFHGDGNDVRFVSSELAPDVVVNVGEVKFYLHKFPLLSKSNKLHSLILNATEEKTNEFYIDDFPGGPKVFETCAKFCYGITVTLNAYNVAAVRCAADYLEMTEDVERQNLIYKIDVFLATSVFQTWKDSIIVLQTTKFLLPWSEKMSKLVGKAVDSIASKASVDPADVGWSYTYSKKMALSDRLAMRGGGTSSMKTTKSNVPSDWWVEDLCELDVELYKKVMFAVKAKGKMPADVVMEGLRTYVIRWLPTSVDVLSSEDHAARNMVLVEAIIWLLPSDRGSGCFCSFLLKLLKVAILVDVEDVTKEELLNKISIQLDMASVKDLLIPVKSFSNTVYDVSLVKTLVARFLMFYKNRGDGGNNNNSNCRSDGLLAVGKLVDGYLAEVACDENLPASTFVSLSRSLPEEARPLHDRLYAAVDIYLQEHTALTKEEKRRICGLLDVKKLSPDACAHAVQNDRLPLRTVVQVLYLGHSKTASAGLPTPAPATYTNGHSRKQPPQGDHDETAGITKRLGSIKVAEVESPVKDAIIKTGKQRGNGLLMPSRSRRIFEKLLLGKVEETNRSSETSGSSQSPRTSINVADTKSSGSSSTRRRFSIS